MPVALAVHCPVQAKSRASIRQRGVIEMTRTMGANLLDIFLGIIDDVQVRDGYFSYRVRRPDEGTLKVTTLHTIKRSTVERIESIFIDALWNLPYNDYLLLWILWVRDDEFGMGAMNESDKMPFAQKVFALNGVSVETNILEEGFKYLVREEYLKKQTGESGIEEYHLTTKARRIVKKLFKKTEDDTFAYIAPTSTVAETKNGTDSEVAKKETKTRRRVPEESLTEAVKLVIDRGVKKKEAERACDLPQGALSKGRGKKLIKMYEKMICHKVPVSEGEGDDFVFNETY